MAVRMAPRLVGRKKPVIAQRSSRKVVQHSCGRDGSVVRLVDWWDVHCRLVVDVVPHQNSLGPVSQVEITLGW